MRIKCRRQQICCKVPSPVCIGSLVAKLVRKHVSTWRILIGYVDCGRDHRSSRNSNHLATADWCFQTRVILHAHFVSHCIVKWAWARSE